MKINLVLFMAVLLAVTLGIVGSAFAATCGTALNPIILSATPTAFGVYSPGSASPTTANGTVTVACTTFVTDTLPSFTVALSTGAGASFSPRQMNFIGSHLNYNLYTAAAFTAVWGDGTGGTSTQSYNASASLGVTSFTVYGRVPTGQYVSTGAYTDTIIVTVNY